MSDVGYLIADLSIDIFFRIFNIQNSLPFGNKTLSKNETSNKFERDQTSKISFWLITCFKVILLR